MATLFSESCMSIDWNWGYSCNRPLRQHYLPGLAVERFSDNRRPLHLGLDHRFLVGSLFGILRTVPNRFLSGIGTCYVELFRNVPLIVQFFTWYLVVPEFLPENIGMWFKSELDPNIQFFVSSMLCLGCLPPLASASRYAPPSSRCRAGRRTPAWRWA